MKRWSFYLFIIMLGCDTPRIVTSSVPDVDFKKFTTYKVTETQDKSDITHPAYDNATNRGILIEAINDQMTKLGYAYDLQTPDLMVMYNLVITEMVDPRYDSAVVYKPWVNTQLDTFNYTEGIMGIKIIDFKQGEMIWQGSVTGILDNSPEKFKKRLQKEVGKLFATLTDQKE
jgi:hypothetical protein